MWLNIRLDLIYRALIFVLAREDFCLASSRSNSKDRELHFPTLLELDYISINRLEEQENHPERRRIFFFRVEFRSP